MVYFVGHAPGCFVVGFGGVVVVDSEDVVAVVVGLGVVTAVGVVGVVGVVSSVITVVESVVVVVAAVVDGTVSAKIFEAIEGT